jgi:hemerythrin superfamily protein
MKKVNSNTTEKEECESHIVRAYPTDHGIAHEQIWVTKVKNFEKHVEEKEEKTVMDVVGEICPELARRLTDIANLLRSM